MRCTVYNLSRRKMYTTAQRLGHGKTNVCNCKVIVLSRFPCHNKVLQTECLNSRKSRAHSSRVWKSEIRALGGAGFWWGLSFQREGRPLAASWNVLTRGAQVERASTHRLPEVSSSKGTNQDGPTHITSSDPGQLPSHWGLELQYLTFGGTQAFCHPYEKQTFHAM